MSNCSTVCIFFIFRSFKEQVAALLSDSYVTVEPYEEQIRERLAALVRSTSDRKSVS